MYYAQFRGKLSNSKKELIPASLFHLREADILIGDWHSFLVRSPSWHTSVSPLFPLGRHQHRHSKFPQKSPTKRHSKFPLVALILTLKVPPELFWISKHSKFPPKCYISRHSKFPLKTFALVDTQSSPWELAHPDTQSSPWTFLH